MTVGAAGEALIWHDLECGAYEADLPLWSELAAAAGSAVLELGCGSGRVALHLARRGSRVTGIDSAPELVAELRRRGAREDLEVRGEVADAAGFELDERFGMIVAPMQLIQLLPGAVARQRCLEAIAAHLEPGGRAALAIVVGAESGFPASPPLPDVHEAGGWVYSSLPLGVGVDDGALTVDRLRQTVAPDGSLREDRNTDRLRVLDADQLEHEARDAGLRPVERLAIDPTAAHVGSAVVVLEA